MEEVLHTICTRSASLLDAGELSERTWREYKRLCDLLVSQCMPGSVSQGNQLRAGFRIAGSKAWWVPLPG